MGNKISKSVSVPLYVQTANKIRNQVSLGVYLPGSKLPKEADLVELFKTSRITIRSALKLLEDEGVVVKRHGIGTFISDEKKTVSINSLEGFYSLLVKSGAKVTTKLQESSVCLPTKTAASLLNINPDLNIRKITRLYYTKDQPFAFIITHFSRNFMISLEEAESLTAYGLLIEKLQSEPMKVSYKVTTRLATIKEREMLELERGAPILILNRVSYCQEGNPLEYTSHFIRPDICELEFTYSKERPLRDLRISNILES